MEPECLQDPATDPHLEAEQSNRHPKNLLFEIRFYIILPRRQRCFSCFQVFRLKFARFFIPAMRTTCVAYLIPLNQIALIIGYMSKRSEAHQCAVIACCCFQLDANILSIPFSDTVLDMHTVGYKVNLHSCRLVFTL